MEAAKKALDAFAEARKAVQSAKADYTVGELWDFWLADRADDGFRNDIYQANWVSLGGVFANRKPILITKTDCKDYARDRFALGRSPWTVNTELSRLRACLEWAVRNKKLKEAPTIWVPSPGKGRTRKLSFEEAKALIEGAGDPHIRLFIILAFNTGARHMAILDLTWDRIDFVNGMINFEVDVPLDPMHKTWTKGRAVVPMNYYSREALEVAYKGRQTEFVIEHGGDRLVTIKNGFAAACERAGIGKYVKHPETGETVFKPSATPHTIRHTVVSWVRERGVERGNAARLAGHKNENTTDLYTHADNKLMLSPAVKVIETGFAALPETPKKPRVAVTRRKPKPADRSQRDKTKGGK